MSLKIISIASLVLSGALFGDIPEEAFNVTPPMNQIYHPVSTTNKEAQKSFDEGLTYIFAFNHDIAFRAFERAASLDPSLAMAYWGMALALGQNVNEDVTPERELRAYQYVQQALKLSSTASGNEKEYIHALAARYTNDPSADFIPLRFRYRDAMKKVVQSYPEDLDAATLYAESILDLDPWKWWTREGKPNEGIMEASDILEFVLLRNPEHIGANHYTIHVWEESPWPERALMSARRLENLLPESGHLLHMPCHIFLLVGDYKSALKTSKRAIEQDRDYIKKVGLSAGTYPFHYLSHCLSVQTRIYMMMEDYANAIKAAFELIDFIKPHFQKMPHLESFAKVPLEVYLYFHRWQDLLNYRMQVTSPQMIAYWHFSRGMAYAALGDVKSAIQEKELMLQSKAQIPKAAEISNNPARKIFDLAEVALNASVAAAENNQVESIALLRKAAELEDQLYYDEPPAWYVSLHQVLGFALLEQKQYVEAESQFQKTLKHLQRNSRTLYGLLLSLEGQGREIDAYWIKREGAAALDFQNAQ